MDIDEEEIKRKHKGDIRTLWKIYISDKAFYNNLYFKISIGLSLSLLLLSYLSITPLYYLIIKVVNITLSILPNLLGFNLGAYILIVGFGGTNILNTITKPLKKQSNYSFYQILNGVLGIAVIVQIITLLMAFLINFWDEIQVNFKWHFENAYIINSIILFIVIFFTIYSILLLVNVVKHVFIFAQTIHFCIYIEKLKESVKTEVQDTDKKNNQGDIIMNENDINHSRNKKNNKKKNKNCLISRPSGICNSA